MNKYWIMTVLRVETDIIASITVSLNWRAVILLIKHAERLKTVVFIGNIINKMCLTSHWSIIFRIMVSPLTLEISMGEIKAEMYKLPITANYKVYQHTSIPKVCS